MVIHMANHQTALDGVFYALSDSTRRAVIHRLGKGPATVSELSKPFDMALPSFMKHLQVLEKHQLIHTTKTGRLRTCRVNPKRLQAAESWMAEQRALWEARTDRLEALVTALHEEEKSR
jgi:DNA-binding transcriptional ArsR family regulator